MTTTRATVLTMAAAAADRLASRSAELLVSIGESDLLAGSLRGDEAAAEYEWRDTLVAVRESVDGLCERICGRWL
jgi:hypothetical protein